jgi:hypothetical protein
MYLISQDGKCRKFTYIKLAYEGVAANVLLIPAPAFLTVAPFLLFLVPPKFKLLLLAPPDRSLKFKLLALSLRAPLARDLFMISPVFVGDFFSSSASAPLLRNFNRDTNDWLERI